MTPELTKLTKTMAADIQYDVKRAGFSVSDEVAFQVAEAHVMLGKDAAMAILNRNGVPMVKKKTGGGEGVGGKAATLSYSVGSVCVFIGF